MFREVFTLEVKEVLRQRQKGRFLRRDRTRGGPGPEDDPSLLGGSDVGRFRPEGGRGQ